MSLIVNMADYIAANSSLVVDTDLFIGGDLTDAPQKCVIIRELPGSFENWSGLEARDIQILAKDMSPVEAETLAYVVYNLLANKPGFAGSELASENIWYCEVVSMPAVYDRGEDGSYIAAASFLVRKA